MIPGLNSNIKHEGKIFHIQTEDSGRKYGHVISHLFLEGVILASVKKTYKDALHLDDAKLEEKVHELIRQSHRKMVQELTLGRFNREAGLETDAPVLDQPAPESEPLQKAEATEPRPPTRSEPESLPEEKTQPELKPEISSEAPSHVKEAMTRTQAESAPADDAAEPREDALPTPSEVAERLSGEPPPRQQERSVVEIFQTLLNGRR